MERQLQNLFQHYSAAGQWALRSNENISESFSKIRANGMVGIRKDGVAAVLRCNTRTMKPAYQSLHAARMP
jgi:hypothetical protein